MKSLKNILSNYADGSIFGSDAPELTSEQLGFIKEHLQKLKARNKYILIGCLVAILVMFVLVIALTAEPKKLEVMIGKSGVIGISIAGLGTYTYRLWKEINYADLLLICVETMDKSALQAIITETWKKI